MNYKNFLEILLTYQKFERQTSELHDMGLDFLEGKYDLGVTVETMFKSTLNTLFTQEGVEWIEWFIYENEWGTKDWSEYKSFEDSGALADPKNVYGSGHNEYYKNISESLLNKANPICSGEEGLSSLKMVIGAYKSAQEKKLIYLEDL